MHSAGFSCTINVQLSFFIDFVYPKWPPLFLLSNSIKLAKGLLKAFDQGLGKPSSNKTDFISLIIKNDVHSLPELPKINVWNTADATLRISNNAPDRNKTNTITADQEQNGFEPCLSLCFMPL